MSLQMFLFSIPEAVIISYLVYILLGSGDKHREPLIIGVLAGLLIPSIRSVAGTFVVNAILYASLLVVLFSLFRVSVMWKRVTAVMVAMPIYIVIEVISIGILIVGFGVDAATIPEVLESNIPLGLLYFLPQVVVSSLLIFMAKSKQVSLFSEGM